MKQFNWENHIPANKLSAVKKAFEHAFGTCEIDDIVPLTGGRSSALVYKVTVNQQPYVMRLVIQIDELSDPSRQFTAMKSAARAGIAPTTHYTSVEDAISIVDFIEHTPVRDRFCSDQELFGELAKSVKSIHSLPLFPKLVDFLDGVDTFIERHHTVGVLPPAFTEEYFRCYSEVQRVYPRHGNDLVSSHNDLNPGNVLHNGGKIWIIDWEVAFANDRYVDLATVNIFFGAGETGEEILLDTYFGESLNEYHRARFFLMRQVCFTYYSMIFMWLASTSRAPKSVSCSSLEPIRLKEFHSRLKSGEISMSSPEEHLLYAKSLMSESLSQMKTARFPEAVRLLESKRN